MDLFEPECEGYTTMVGGANTLVTTSYLHLYDYKQQSVIKVQMSAICIKYRFLYFTVFFLPILASASGIPTCCLTSG